MREILLQHEELLFLLDKVHAHAVVSIDETSLLPADLAKRRAILERGQASLLQRNLLRAGKTGTLELDTSLLATITTLAFPEIAILVIQNDRRGGLRFFWFYQSGNNIIEHTVTSEKMHHLIAQMHVPALIERIEEILPIHDRDASQIKVAMDQSVFFKVKELVENHDLEQAQGILKQQGFSDAVADSILHVFERPISAGNIAFLRCAGASVVDGRNIALLQDEKAAWSARQIRPGEPALILETTDAPELKEQLISYFKELSSETYLQ